MKIQYMFMRLVSKALSILMMGNLGYDIRSMFHVWENYKDDFLTEMAKEESK